MFSLLQDQWLIYLQAAQQYPAFRAGARHEMVLPPVAPKKAIVGLEEDIRLAVRAQLKLRR
jgi:hypothetical protein